MPPKVIAGKAGIKKAPTSNTNGVLKKSKEPEPKKEDLLFDMLANALRKPAILTKNLRQVSPGQPKLSGSSEEDLSQKPQYSKGKKRSSGSTPGKGTTKHVLSLVTVNNKARAVLEGTSNYDIFEDEDKGKKGKPRIARLDGSHFAYVSEGAQSTRYKFKGPTTLPDYARTAPSTPPPASQAVVPPQPSSTLLYSEHVHERKQSLEEARKKIAQRGIRTYRIWHPQQQRRSIVVKIGADAGRDREHADAIFRMNTIRQQSFDAWRKHAKALLPSVTGGTPVENINEVLNAAPTLQKETDPRVVRKTLRRLSLDSRKSTKVSTSNKNSSSSSSGSSSSGSEEDTGTVAKVESDEEAKRLEEKKKEGKDIRGKMCCAIQSSLNYY